MGCALEEMEVEGEDEEAEGSDSSRLVKDAAPFSHGRMFGSFGLA